MAVTLAAVGLLGACSPSLIIRHEDPTHDRALIWLDGKRAGVVRYDDTLRVRVARGRHTIRAVAPGSDESPWHLDRPEVEVVIEDEATMTLLTPPPR